MKYLISSLLVLITPLLAEERAYLYTAAGGVVTTAAGIPFPVPDLSGVQASLGKRTLFGKHGWDLSCGFAAVHSAPSGFIQSSYLFYPISEKGIYYGGGLGVQAGLHWDVRYVDAIFPITLGYEFNRSFLQGQIQPILLTSERYLLGKTRGLSLSYGYKF